MKKFINPGTVLGLIVAVAGAVILRPEAVLIGLGMMAVGLVMFSIKRSGELREENPIDQVSNENRSRILPIQRLSKEIDELVSSNADNPVVKVIGGEAQEDARKIVASSIHVLNVRDSLRKSVASQAEVDKTVGRLERQLSAAENEEEKEMLRSAIELHSAQGEHIDKAKAAIESIDANLAQAHAVLSELKTRLALAASGSADLDQEDMRDTISRLHSLGASMDEAEQFLGGVQ